MAKDRGYGRRQKSHESPTNHFYKQQVVVVQQQQQQNSVVVEQVKVRERVKRVSWGKLQ